ncbi:MAG: Spi family protease inhibitor, partial [Paludibacteraceae bacterium]|nr:Spi family protease inhibitor [Paludibacteraceae bacterium]
MKKIFLGLVALMVSVTLMAERVSVEDATLVANHFMNSAATSSLKKATPAKRMVHKAVAEENLYYIYQNADGEGWVIVAADDAVMPILAYSETGTFRTDNMPVNIRKWMGKYNNFIRKIEDDGVAASAETQAEWKALRN